MARKPSPGDDEVAVSEDQLEAVRRDRAALAEISQADDEARRAEQQLELLHRERRQLLYQLIREHSPWVRRLAARLVGDHDADDVAQEAFMSFVHWLRTHPWQQGTTLLTSPSESRALLCTMTLCRGHDVLRRRRDVLPGSGDEIEQTARARATAPELGVEFERLDAAYRALKPLQRIAHVLHHHYGFTDTELATALGITKTASRTLVCRANRALKRAMETKK